MARLNKNEQMARHNKAKELANSLGGELLSTPYQGVDAKYKWRCKLGHEWQASYYSVVQRGQWCGRCHGTLRTPEEQLFKAKIIAQDHGGVCLSSEYKGSTQKLEWKCQYGHVWEASLSNISRGKWCPWCAGNKVDAATQLKRAQQTAKSHGGILLSNTYERNKTPMRWCCAEGHEWEASFSTVVGRKAWCGRCLGTQREAEEQLSKARAVAESKNGQCISKIYLNNAEPMEWQCERGHKWKAPFYVVVQAGSWCPTCSTGLKERLVRHTLENLFGVTFKKSRPRWLRNPRTGRLMELDGLNTELNLAFEYQGPQHYKVVKPFKMKQEHLDRGQYRDEAKKELCRKHGIALLEVPYTIEPHEFPKWIYTTIEKKFPEQRFVERMRDWHEIQSVEWVESDHYTIYDLHSHAQSKNGACLSESYLGSRAKHHWLCAEGHKWEATWDSIINQNSWCPICCGNIKENPLHELQELARKHGGKLVSKEFNGMQIKHRWRCAKGHEWDVKPSHIKSSNSWCPICSGRIILAHIQSLQKIAEQRGGKCLSKEYINSKTKLLWKCAEGHEWLATPSSIKSGRWCPLCAVKSRAETRKTKSNVQHKIV